MKTYTDHQTGKRFIADLHAATGKAMQLDIYELGQTDPALQIPVPAHMAGKAMVAFRRNNSERLERVAMECIDINAGFDPAYSGAAE